MKHSSSVSGSRWQPVGVSVVSLMVGYGVSKTSGKEWVSQRKIVSKVSVIVSKGPVGTDYYGVYVNHLVLSEGCNPGSPEGKRTLIQTSLHIILNHCPCYHG